MNRLLMIGSLALMLVATTGCLHNQVRKNSGGCQSGNCGSGGGCQSGNCGSTGGCNSCGANANAYGASGACVGEGCNGECGSGTCGRVGGMCGVCGGKGCRTGCIPGRIGWQQGGLDYSAHLRPGLLGHHAGDALNSRPFTPGPPTASVGYPYYTHRGPRDFLIDNPPTIGR